MQPKRNSIVFIVAILFILVLFGCQEKRETTEKESKTEIKISGSGTCLPLIKILANEYSQKKSNLKFNFLPGVHSGGGIKGVANNTLDIGTVSRELTPEEKNLNLKYFLISNDPVAVGTHRDVGIGNITLQELKGIYSGEITNWKQLNGPNEVIKVLDRNEDESAKIILRKYLIGDNLKITPNAANLYYESDMIDALTKTPSSIGYFSYGYVKSKKLPITILAIDGISPTIENSQIGKYKCLRPLGIVTRQKIEPEVKDFIDFILSSDGSEVMEKYEYNPES